MAQKPESGGRGSGRGSGKVAEGLSAPSKGGYKSRRNGVRLEGHIDHILRRRIVVRERELIPKGLRLDLAPEMSLGTTLNLGTRMCNSERWDGFGAPAMCSHSEHLGTMHLHGEAFGGAPHDSFMNALPSSGLYSRVDGHADGNEYHGARTHDCRRCASTSSDAGADGALGSSRGIWQGGSTDQLSLMHLLRAPSDAPSSHLQGNLSGLYSFVFIVATSLCLSCCGILHVHEIPVCDTL